MAVTSQEIKDTYPLPLWNYKVEIGSDTVAFSEVSGLDIAYETTTYKESPITSGTPGPRVMHMPAQGTPANITMRKGVVRERSVAALYRWISTIKINQVEKKDVFIRLCDDNGDAVISWKVTNAFPTRLEAPTFDANSTDVAIESMELMGDGVQITET